MVCLARDDDSGLWKRAQVTSVGVAGVGVTFDEQRREAVLEYSAVLPLGGWGRGGGAVFSIWVGGAGPSSIPVWVGLWQNHLQYLCGRGCF